jgi:hypothetical protein
MKKALFLSLGLLFFLPACASRATVQSQPILVEDTLYFGTSTPQGPVTPSQWSAFLSDEVTPRFPDGLTVWDAKGQWKDAKGKIDKEPTKVLLLVHPDNLGEDQAVQAIINIYKKKFDQESVLKIRVPANISF